LSGEPAIPPNLALMEEIGQGPDRQRNKSHTDDND
jgi:hypothetical protein